MVSVYSIILSLFNSSLMTLILILLRKNTTFLKRYGLSPLLMLARCCIIRMLFPIHFLGHAFLLQEKCLLPPGSLSRYAYFLSFKSFFLAIWAFGFLANFTYHIARGFRLRKKLYHNAVLAEDHVNEILYQIDPKCPMKVYISPDISIPLIAGIIHPQIYIPDFSYDTKDLHYIILHEYNHWKSKDTITKTLLHLFHSLMWWNLTTYFITREYHSILEMDCDFSMCNGLTSIQKAEYMQTLQRILQDMKNRQEDTTPSVPKTKFRRRKGSRDSTLYQRVALILYRENPGCKGSPSPFLLSCFFLFWLAVSYC